jgi:hypothetical protein
MFETMRTLRTGLQELIEELDPGALDGTRALRLMDEFVAMERLVEAGKVLVTRRIAETEAWRREGDRSHAHFVARKTGTSVAQAVGVVQAARRLEAGSATEDALRAGDLSAEQTGEITAATDADPHAENELLETAATEGLAALRDESRRVKAAARNDQIAHHAEIHRRRYLRTYTDRDGAACGSWRTTPEAGAVIAAELEARAEQLAAAAKKAGVPTETAEAYRADALVELAETSRDGDRARPRRVVTITGRIDHAAWRRGNTYAGEFCEIDGVGPVPVPVMWDLADDALLYGIVTNGTNLTHMAKLGGDTPEALRRAVHERDRSCVVPGCSERGRVDVDHITPRARNGPHAMANLCLLCKFHHALKTYDGWQIRGSPGNWEWTPPDRSPPADAWSQLALDERPEPLQVLPPDAA